MLNALLNSAALSSFGHLVSVRAWGLNIKAGSALLSTHAPLWIFCTLCSCSMLNVYKGCKKARIFCIFSLLNIQYTYSWHINLWHQGLFLKPWTVWYSLAYLPALRLLGSCETNLQLMCLESAESSYPTQSLLWIHRMLPPALSHQINDIMQGNIRVK